MNQTNDHRQRVLVNVSKELQNWSIMVRKMKAIYYTLNLFNVDVTKKCLIGECWIPQNDIETVKSALTTASVSNTFMIINIPKQYIKQNCRTHAEAQFLPSWILLIQTKIHQHLTEPTSSLVGSRTWSILMVLLVIEKLIQVEFTLNVFSLYIFCFSGNCC